MPNIIVYYDGSCALCSRTIRFHRHSCPSEANVVWQDISRDMQGLGIPFEEATRQFLVRDAEGKLHRGIDAFIFLWGALPRLKLLARIASIAPVRALLSFYYGIVAERHSKKHLGHAPGKTPKKNKGHL